MGFSGWYIIIASQFDGRKRLGADAGGGVDLSGHEQHHVVVQETKEKEVAMVEDIWPAPTLVGAREVFWDLSVGVES